MPMYLVQASLSVDALEGTLSEGGTQREAALRETIEGLGGKLVGFYYAYGEYDVVTLVEAPDNVTVAAIAATVGAAGVASTNTTELLTPEEMDEVAEKSVSYRPPGS